MSIKNGYQFEGFGENVMRSGVGLVEKPADMIIQQLGAAARVSPSVMRVLLFAGRNNNTQIHGAAGAAAAGAVCSSTGSWELRAELCCQRAEGCAHAAASSCRRPARVRPNDAMRRRERAQLARRPRGRAAPRRRKVLAPGEVG